MSRACKHCGCEVSTSRGAPVCVDCSAQKLADYRDKYWQKYRRARGAPARPLTDDERERRKILRHARITAKTSRRSLNCVLKEWGEKLVERKAAYEYQD